MMVFDMHLRSHATEDHDGIVVGPRIEHTTLARFPIGPLSEGAVAYQARIPNQPLSLNLWVLWRHRNLGSDFNNILVEEKNGTFALKYPGDWAPGVEVDPAMFRVFLAQRSELQRCSPSDIYKCFAAVAAEKDQCVASWQL